MTYISFSLSISFWRLTSAPHAPKVVRINARTMHCKATSSKFFACHLRCTPPLCQVTRVSCTHGEHWKPVRNSPYTSQQKEPHAGTNYDRCRKALELKRWNKAKTRCRLLDRHSSNQYPFNVKTQHLMRVAWCTSNSHNIQQQHASDLSSIGRPDGASVTKNIPRAIVQQLCNLFEWLKQSTDKQQAYH